MGPERDRAWEVVQRALEDGEPFELTYRIVDGEGTVKRVWERGKVVPGEEGSPEVLKGFITDVVENHDPDSTEPD